MADSTNTIEVVIKAVDQLSADVKNMQQNLAGLGGEIEKVKKHGEESDKSFSSLKDTFKEVAEAVGALFIFEKISEFLKEASADAAGFELRMVTLTNTVELFGKSAEAKGLIEFTDEMRKSQGVSRELALEVENILVTLSDLGDASDSSGEKLKKLTEISIALANATGRSPESTAVQIANYLSNPTALTLGRGLNQPNLPLSERPDFLIQQYGPVVEGAKRSLDTLIGAQRQLSQSVEQIGHELGEKFNEPLKESTKTLAEFAEEAKEFIEHHQGLANAFVVVSSSVSVLVTVFGTLAAIKYLEIIANIAKLGVALAAFAVTPAGLAAIGVALLAAGATALFVKNSIDSAGKSGTERVEEQAKKVDDLKAKLAEIEKNPAAKDPNTTVGRYADTLRAQIAEAQAALESFEIPPPKDAEVNAVSQRANLLRSLKEQVEADAQKMKATLVKSAIEVQASGQQLVFETTGSIDALERSFELRRRAITESADATIRAKLVELAHQHGLKPEELPADITGPIASNIRGQEQGELAKLALEKQKALQDAVKARLDLEISLNSAISKNNEAIGGVRLENAKNDLTLAQLRGDSAEKLLDLTLKQTQAQKSQIALQINGEQLAASDARRKADLEQDPTKQAALLEQARQHTIEVDKLQAKFDEINLDLGKTLQAGTGLTDQFDKMRKATDQVSTNIKSQIELAIAQNQPWSEVTKLADDLYQSQLKSLNVEKDKLEFLVKENEVLLSQGQGNPAVLEDLQAQLSGVQIQINNLPLEVRKVIDAFDPLTEVGKEIQKSFVDAFSSLFDILTDKTKSFTQKIDALAIKMGENVTKGLFQNLIVGPASEDLTNAWDKLLGKPTVEGRQSSLARTFGGLGSGLSGIWDRLFGNGSKPTGGPGSFNLSGAGSLNTGDWLGFGANAGRTVPDLNNGFTFSLPEEAKNVVLGPTNTAQGQVIDTINTNIQALNSNTGALNDLTTALGGDVTSTPAIGGFGAGGGAGAEATIAGQAGALGTTQGLLGLAGSINQLAGGRGGGPLGILASGLSIGQSALKLWPQLANLFGSGGPGTFNTAGIGLSPDSVLNTGNWVGWGANAGVPVPDLNAPGVTFSLPDIPDIPIPEFAKGGIILNDKTVHRFATGGRVMGGPVLGVVGEEGDELIARMLPASGGGGSRLGPMDSEAYGPREQHIHIWDQRPKGVNPQDVITITADNLDRGGVLHQRVHNVIKRTK